MNSTISIEGLTIHRIVEQQLGFHDAIDFLPDLTADVLAENRGWLEPWAIDGAASFRSLGSDARRAA